ncbi:MAG: DUF4269 domain-containing protein [bacterium]|nr:DUF4269 domain-containing protein [bacterium]
MVGTIPLDVDLPESDLDIICEIPAVVTPDQFEAGLARHCARFATAKTPPKIWKRPGKSTEAAFCELFAISIPADKDEYRALYDSSPSGNGNGAYATVGGRCGKTASNRVWTSARTLARCDTPELSVFQAGL